MNRVPGVPILFLTGHSDIPLSVKAIRGGVVNFLTKPVREDVLLSAVGQALATHENYIKNNNEEHEMRVSLATLTSREIMRYILSGARNRQNGLY